MTVVETSRKLLGDEFGGFSFISRRASSRYSRSASGLDEAPSPVALARLQDQLFETVQDRLAWSGSEGENVGRS